MAKPYKSIRIKIAFSSKEHSEDNLDKFINNETIADDEKLILQNILRCVDRHEPYRERPLKVNVIDQPQHPSSEGSISPPEQPMQEKEDLSKALSIVVNLMAQS